MATKIDPPNGARSAPGKHYFMLWRTIFEVDLRYLPLKPIGKGAYGIVCAARDLESGANVAIKRITNVFENTTDARRTLREIKLLRHLFHENIISVKDIMTPACKHTFKDLYVVYELMDTDLHQIIRSSQLLNDDHHQYLIYQLCTEKNNQKTLGLALKNNATRVDSNPRPLLERLGATAELTLRRPHLYMLLLRGLKYLHSANVLHRDLKPSNLLLNANCDLKICDFGLARTGPEKGQFMTEYVVTRWYRAPELLLTCDEYGSAIDIWSVGCIFAELLGRKPIFPGKDYLHQLKLILSTIGTPGEDDLHFIPNETARSFIRSQPYAPHVSLGEIYPKANPVAIDLIDKMLVFDPRKRITVIEALNHPYLAMLHDENLEPTAPSPFDSSFEDEDLKEHDLREKVWVEMRYYHPESATDMC